VALVVELVVVEVVFVWEVTVYGLVVEAETYFDLFLNLFIFSLFLFILY
jgi:hypothetical protein